MKSLSDIEKVKNGHLEVLKKEKWLMYLALTSESNINLERLSSLDETKNNYVLEYVERTLKLLSNLNLKEYHNYLIGETLKWSEVAKSGLMHQRKQWMEKRYNLFVHNVGSAQIYQQMSTEANESIKKIIYNLILTHGLIGQYIRGEVPLLANMPLYQLVEEGIIISLFGDKANIVELKSFLQNGYTIALSQKVEIFDEKRYSVRLPDSTCLVVIEKLDEIV